MFDIRHHALLPSSYSAMTSCQDDFSSFHFNGLEVKEKKPTPRASKNCLLPRGGDQI
jgi:hypothetical protein